jgi:hypothetical protein
MRTTKPAAAPRYTVEPFSSTLLVWTAGTMETSSPAMRTVPPIPMPCTFFRPLRSSQLASSNTATIGAPVARDTGSMSPA